MSKLFPSILPTQENDDEEEDEEISGAYDQDNTNESGENTG
ncbi:hypothetical protein J2751_002133 [Halorubrum alkaliphilum]|uniref:Uncharacterized protein n=1 Tax=Halorubrum alkaliphilum TaxID=261290 RepID=A0A8T4GFX2_9EURY|nr:hypothetical protein [Halorubrum alkaliphilum]